MKIDYKNKKVLAAIVLLGFVISILGYTGIKSGLQANGYEAIINSMENSSAEYVHVAETSGNHSDIDSDEQIWIHVTGCVKNPGAVKINKGQRIKDAVEAAGGFLPEADTDSINMAYALKDGQKVYIASKNGTSDRNKTTPVILQNEHRKVVIAANTQGVTQSSEGVVDDMPIASDKSDGKININEASEAELDKLPGVGPATAAKIIEYRQKNGEYKKAEDIMNVYGIGKSKFDKMKHMITVD